MTESNISWGQQRRENARLLAEKQRLREQAESEQAQEFLNRFAAAAKETGLASTPLEVRGYGGKGTARTSLRGWMLMNSPRLAVDTDGNFYLLTQQLSLRDRLVGVTPKPSAPPLILGRGGRDGESMDLTVALDKLLPQWRSAGS